MLSHYTKDIGIPGQEAPEVYKDRLIKSALLLTLLMTVLSETFFTFVGSYLMTFSLFTARHTNKFLKIILMNLYVRQYSC